MTDEVNELPVGVVEEQVVIDVKPSEKIKKKRRSSAEVRAAKLAVQKAKAEPKEVSVEDTIIEWSERKGRDANSTVIWQRGDYRLGEFFNQLKSVLATRKAVFEYQKEDNGIEIRGMFGYRTFLTLSQRPDNILRIARATPVRKGQVGKGEFN